MNNDLSIKIDDVLLNVRVAAVLYLGDKIIVEKNKKNDYHVLPGGRIKTLEDSGSAVVRELKEELGIDFSDEEKKLICLVENFFMIGEQKYHEIYYIYKIKITKDIDVYDGMDDFDKHTSEFFLKTIDEIQDIKMLPVELKSIVKQEQFEHIVVNELI